MEYTKVTKVTFVQVIDNKSFVIECRYCEGRGQRPDKEFADTRQIATWIAALPCPICNAKGMLRLESSDIPTNCGMCQGTGRNTTYGIDDIQGRRVYSVRNDIPCNTCRGLGVLSLTGQIKKLT